MKLHIGCGKKIFQGWTNLDIEERPGVDLVDDARTLSKVADKSCELIYACHILEHLGRNEVADVLTLWHRKLQPGGLLRLAVPDFGKAVERYRDKGDLQEVMGLIVGGQRNEFDYHGAIFDTPYLAGLLKQAGFKEIGPWDWRATEHADIDDYSQAYLPHMDKENGMLVSLNLEARA